MIKADIEFANDERGMKERKKFIEKCRDPKFVLRCVKKYQRWRKGLGEYKWTGDPSKEKPMPFCGESLSIVLASVIAFLEGGCNAKRGIKTPNDKRRKCKRRVGVLGRDGVDDGRGVSRTAEGAPRRHGRA